MLWLSAILVKFKVKPDEQHQFYLANMATIAHKKLVCLQDYEELAYEILPEAILSFYKGGADQEQTLRDNRDAFKRYNTEDTQLHILQLWVRYISKLVYCRWRLMPRMLRGVESRSMTTTALGLITFIT